MKINENEFICDIIQIYYFFAFELIRNFVKIRVVKIYLE